MGQKQTTAEKQDESFLVEPEICGPDACRIYVNVATAGLRTTRKKVIAKAIQTLYSIESQQVSVSFLEDPLGNDLIEGLGLFRAQFENTMTVGTLERIEIDHQFEPDTEEIVIQPLSGAKSISESPSELINDDDEDHQIDSVSLQSSYKDQTVEFDYNIKLVCYSIEFGSENSIEIACRWLFNQRNPNFVGVDFTSTENQSESISNVNRSIGIPSTLSTNRQTTVSASLVAQIIGFLEKPWSEFVITRPVLSSVQLNQVKEDWTIYNRTYHIKLRYLQHVTIPRYLLRVEPLSNFLESNLETTTTTTTTKNQMNLESNETGKCLCVEYWNRTESGFEWKHSDRHIVPLWKTTVFLTDSNLKRLAIPRLFHQKIWNVVDEQAQLTLGRCMPVTLEQQCIKQLVHSYPNWPNAQMILKYLKPELVQSLIEALLRSHAAGYEYLKGDSINDKDRKGLSLFVGSQVNHIRLNDGTTTIRTDSNDLVESLICLSDSLISLDLSKSQVSSNTLDRVIPQMTNLFELNLSNCQQLSSMNDWSFVRQPNHIHELTIEGLQSIDPTFFESLIHMKSLRKLNLNQTAMRQIRLAEFLSGLTSLTQLDIGYESKTDISSIVVDDQVIQSLKQLILIEELTLPGWKISGQSLVELSQSLVLRSLKLSNFNGYSKHYQLGYMTSLMSLSLIQSQVEDRSLEYVCRYLTNLVELNVSQNYLTGDGVKEITNLKSLKRLDLSFNCIGQDRESDHWCLLAMTRLESLNLTENPIISSRQWLRGAAATQHLAALAKLTNLTELQIGGDTLTVKSNGIEDSGVYHIQNLIRLNRLSVSNNSLTDDCLFRLGRLRNLIHLDISGNQVTNDCLKNLLNLIHLRSIDASRTLLSDGSLIQLSRLKKLEKIIAINARFSERALIVCLRLFPHLTLII